MIQDHARYSLGKSMLDPENPSCQSGLLSLLPNPTSFAVPFRPRSGSPVFSPKTRRTPLPRPPSVVTLLASPAGEQCESAQPVLRGPREDGGRDGGGGRHGGFHPGALPEPAGLGHRLLLLQEGVRAGGANIEY